MTGAVVSGHMGVLDQFTLDGDVAFVTGGASGIGKHIGMATAEAGADVVLADIDESGAAEAADEIEDETGARTLPVEVDVTDPNAVDGAIEATVWTRPSPTRASPNSSDRSTITTRHSGNASSASTSMGCSTPTGRPPR